MLLAFGLAAVGGAWSGCGTNDAPTPEQMTASAREAIRQSRSALDAGDYIGARRPLEHLPPSHRSASTEFLLGRIWFETGRLDSAEAAYARAAQFERDYPGLWHNRGNVSFQARRYREAADRYRAEIKRAPAAQPFHGLGGALHALGVVDSARLAYEHAVAIDSDYGPALVSLAQLLEAEGRFDEALTFADRADAVGHGGGDVQTLRGRLLSRAGRPDDAAAVLEQAVTQRPWDYAAWYALGQARQQQGRPDAAREALTRADRVRSEQAEVERLERTASDQPASFAAQMTHADALRRSGRLPEALVAYRRAAMLQPERLDLRNNIGTVLAQIGRRDEARAVYDEILRLDTGNAEAWLNLGILHAADGDMAEARGAWEKARGADTAGGPVAARAADLLARTAGR